jgi:hypothetical protein
VTGEVHVNPSKFVFDKTYWSGNGAIYKSGDVIWILDYMGEAEYNAWDGNKVVMVEFYQQIPAASSSAICSHHNAPIDCAGKLVEPLESNWWVNIEYENGVSGWTNEANGGSGKMMIPYGC